MVAGAQSMNIMQFDPRFETVVSDQQPNRAYPAFAESNAVLQDLFDDLDPLPAGVATVADLRGMLEASSPGDVFLVQLRVRSRGPEEAARVANLWAERFVARANEVFGLYGGNQLAFFAMQLERAQGELEAADRALALSQAPSQAVVLDAHLASVRQDLQDYLVGQREVERLIRNVQLLLAKVATQPPEAHVGLGDDLTALLLQVQAFAVQTTPPVEMPSPEDAWCTEERESTAACVWVQVVGGGTEPAPSLSLQIQMSGSALGQSGTTVAELVASLEDLEASLTVLDEETRAELARLESQIPDLQEQLQGAEAEVSRLARERDVALETFVALARRVEEARIGDAYGGAGLRLASGAGIPDQPAGPRVLISVIVAASLGVVLSTLVSFAVEWWREDGAPTLADG